jgi:hypothetical protein
MIQHETTLWIKDISLEDKTQLLQQLHWITHSAQVDAKVSSMQLN